MDRADRAAMAFFAKAASVRSLGVLSQDFGQVASAAGFHAAACFDLARHGEPVSPRFLFGWNLAETGAAELQRLLFRSGETLQAILMSSSALLFGRLSLGAADGQVTVLDLSADTLGGLVVPVHGPQGEIMCVAMIAQPGGQLTPQQRMTLQVASTILANRGRVLVECEGEATSNGEPSAREAECAYWVNQGKNDWEIGRILRLSEDSVAFHLSTLMEKFNVSRRSELPPSAWRSGASSNGEG